MKKRGANKKAAMELSIGTIVIIVLAMSMLVLGLILIQRIFTGTTESVDDLNARVQGEITKLFTEEDNNIVVKLGSDKTATIKAGTDDFNIAIGARTLDGSNVDLSSFKYKLTLDDNARENCLVILKRDKTEKLFKQKLDSFSEFDQYQGDKAFALVEVTIPEGTPKCTQKVFIDVQDKNEMMRGVFKINVEKKGFF